MNRARFLHVTFITNKTDNNCKKEKWYILTINVQQKITVRIDNNCKAEKKYVLTVIVKHIKLYALT
jgi:hypothetical protein